MFCEKIIRIVNYIIKTLVNSNYLWYNDIEKDRQTP